MQTLTMTGRDLITVVNYLFPDLDTHDFNAIKFSDDENVYLEWHTDKYPEPSMDLLDSKLLEAKNAKLEAEASKVAQKEALLSKLGITEQEAGLLLK